MGEMVSFWVKKSSTVFIAAIFYFKTIIYFSISWSTMHGEMVVGIF